MTTFPSGLLPMKAVNGTLLPEDDGGWAFEIKWDGMRLLAYVDPGAAAPLRLQTTRGHDAVPRYPELAGLADAVGRPAVLDGEVVVLDENGRSDFGRLQRHEDAVTFIVFDLLWLDGNDVTALPYLDRRRLLADLVEDGEGWLVPTHLVGDGAVLFDQARANGLEGLVAKRIDSPYLPGKRSPAWRKVKIRRAQEFVVGGWLPGEGNRTGLARGPPRRLPRRRGPALRRPGRHRLHRGRAPSPPASAGRSGHRRLALRRRAAPAGPAPGPLRPPRAGRPGRVR